MTIARSVYGELTAAETTSAEDVIVVLSKYEISLRTAVGQGNAYLLIYLDNSAVRITVNTDGVLVEEGHVEITTMPISRSVH